MVYFWYIKMSSDDQLPDVLAGSTDRLKNMG